MLFFSLKLYKKSLVFIKYFLYKYTFSTCHFCWDIFAGTFLGKCEFLSVFGDVTVSKIFGDVTALTFSDVTSMGRGFFSAM